MNINEKERQVDLLYRTKYEKGEVNEAFLVISDGGEARIHTLSQPSDDQVKEILNEPR